MSDVDVIPELKQILGAMLFAAKAPLSLAEIRRILQQTGEIYGGNHKEFGKLKEADIAEAMQQLATDLAQAHAGVHVSEVANGFRLHNDSGCGPWLRVLLDKGRAQRLSKPALETLAIIAYRQPVTRGEIEGVRGVAVDAIIKNLMELQLIKIIGRSELPGRPWLFGTSQKFLESFGLKNMEDLPSIQELRRMQSEQEEREIAVAAAKAAGKELPAQDEMPLSGTAAPAAADESSIKETKSEDKPMGYGREDIDRDYEGEVEEEYEEEEDEEKEDDAEEEEEEVEEEKDVAKVEPVAKADKDEEAAEEDEDDEEYDDDEFEDDDEDDDEEDEEEEEEEEAELEDVSDDKDPEKAMEEDIAGHADDKKSDEPPAKGRRGKK